MIRQTDNIRPRCAFFDVDTRIISESGENLVIGPRADAIRPQVEELFAFASRFRVPVAATTCVQTPSILSAVRPGMTYIPVSSPQRETLEQLDSSLAIFIERRSCGSGDANVANRVFDVFHANPAAEQCIRGMNVRRWAVFGVSLEYCFRSACAGLCRLGLDVTILTDAVVPSPRPFGKSSQEVLQELAAAGAHLESTDTYLRKLAANA